VLQDLCQNLTVTWKPENLTIDTCEVCVFTCVVSMYLVDIKMQRCRHVYDINLSFVEIYRACVLGGRGRGGSGEGGDLCLASLYIPQKK
jgi:hypothetical protein